MTSGKGKERVGMVRSHVVLDNVGINAIFVSE